MLQIGHSYYAASVMLSLALVVLKDKFVVLGLGLAPRVLVKSLQMLICCFQIHIMVGVVIQLKWLQCTYICAHQQRLLMWRKFSHSGLLLRPHRARMSKSLLETLVFLKYNSACV